LAAIVNVRSDHCFTVVISDEVGRIREYDTVGFDVFFGVFNDLSAFQSTVENLFGGIPVGVIGIEIHERQVNILLL
jgi:hypothetical protein